MRPATPPMPIPPRQRPPRVVPVVTVRNEQPKTETRNDQLQREVAELTERVQRLERLVETMNRLYLFEHSLK